tara:strand:+ start:38063 stop:38974 length:912 start_codon:yes stop_codon:yes gene_type:complete
MTTVQIGDARVHKVVETEREPESFDFVFPRGNWEVCETNRARLEGEHIDFDRRAMLMSFHSYVISHGGVNVLVDGCIGNTKNRTGPGVSRYFGTDYNLFHMRDTAYLMRLADAGFPPESIDYVLCTHLHCDHVGWFTRLRDGAWEPTFKNARYVFASKEFAAAQAAWQNNPEGPFERSFEDSVQPVATAGLVDLVQTDHEIRPGLFLEPAPGHTPGHVLIHLECGGDHGIFSGDVIHSPYQLLDPGVSPVYDANDFKQARATRDQLLQRIVGTNTTVFTAHFGESSCGSVIADAGGAYWFDFL